MTIAAEFANAAADAVSIGASVGNKIYADVLNEILGNGTEILLAYSTLGSKGLIEFSEDEGGLWIKMKPTLVHAAVADGVIPAVLAPYFDESIPRSRRKWSGIAFAAWTEPRRSRMPKDLVERARAIHAEIMKKVESKA